MEKEETAISTPNEATPHLTEAEIAAAREMSRQQNILQNHSEFCYFRKMAQKPQKQNRPMTFNDKGEVVEHDGYPSPINKGNPTKGSLRNKKCSCGSGKRYKQCCLNNTRRAT